MKKIYTMKDFYLAIATVAIVLGCNKGGRDTETTAERVGNMELDSTNVSQDIRTDEKGKKISGFMNIPWGADMNAVKSAMSGSQFVGIRQEPGIGTSEKENVLVFKGGMMAGARVDSAKFYLRERSGFCQAMVHLKPAGEINSEFQKVITELGKEYGSPEKSTGTGVNWFFHQDPQSTLQCGINTTTKTIDVVAQLANQGELTPKDQR